jgi:hypothetical protein
LRSKGSPAFPAVVTAGIVTAILGLQVDVANAMNNGSKSKKNSTSRAVTRHMRLSNITHDEWAKLSEGDRAERIDEALAASWDTAHNHDATSDLGRNRTEAAHAFHNLMKFKVREGYKPGSLTEITRKVLGIDGPDGPIGAAIALLDTNPNGETSEIRYSLARSDRGLIMKTVERGTDGKFHAGRTVFKNLTFNEGLWTVRLPRQPERSGRNLDALIPELTSILGAPQTYLYKTLETQRAGTATRN